MQDILKKYSPTFGFLALFLGLVVLCLAYYGRDLTYTQTYYHLSELLKPAVDVWALLVGVAFIANLMLFVLMPNVKLGTLSMLRRRQRLRMVVGVSGLIVSSLVGLVVITGQVYKIPWMVSILAKMSLFIPLIILGGAGLVALFFAMKPAESVVARQWLNFKGRVAALVIAVLTALLLALMIEVILRQPPVEQVLTSNNQVHGKPTHSISVILGQHPSRLRPGDSVPLELLFRLTRFNPAETAKRYPITLNPSHAYAASAGIRTVGIEYSKLPAALAKPRAIRVGDLLSWTWIISAKPNREGTNQSVALDVFLHDTTEGTIVFNAPLTTIGIDVDTPLGLPTWLISPQVGIGAIFGGIITIFLPWALAEMSARRRDVVNPPKIVPP